MKYLIFLIVFIVTFSCQSINGIEEQPECPESFECFTETINNKKISPFKDTIGETYLRLLDSENSMVIKYIYKYKSSQKMVDGGYSETIFFQIPKNIKTLKLKNAELSDVKLYILKSCFCRDAGYEQILKGDFKLRKKNNTIIVDLLFDVQKDVKLNSFKTEIEL